METPELTMRTRDAVQHYGGIRELAAALGIWPHNISRWGEYPPKARQYQLEVLTDGALQAERRRAKK
jgi:hypothetical protein